MGRRTSCWERESGRSPEVKLVILGELLYSPGTMVKPEAAKLRP